MALKSLVVRAEIQQVKSAHNCQASKHHRLNRGDIRLAVYGGRSPDHYCLDCARKIIERDLEKLQLLAAGLPGEQFS